jgi:hypothetical protein
MSSTSLAHVVRNPETRLGRAVALFEERGDEIERIAPDVDMVPSSDGSQMYRVDYGNELCNCPDSEYHPETTCKHVLALGISLAKRRRSLPCAACGTRMLCTALVEVQEGHKVS